MSDVANAHRLLDSVLSGLVVLVDQPGVADQHIDGLFFELACKPAHTLERPKIEAPELSIRIRMLVNRSFHSGASRLLVPAGKYHACSGCTKRPRRFVTDARIRTGHDHELARQVNACDHFIASGLVIESVPIGHSELPFIFPAAKQ